MVDAEPSAAVCSHMSALMALGTSMMAWLKLELCIHHRIAHVHCMASAVAARKLARRCWRARQTALEVALATARSLHLPALYHRLALVSCQTIALHQDGVQCCQASDTAEWF